jgi:3-phosphoshikimate 1-carboxyvinyltransferase
MPLPDLIEIVPLTQPVRAEITVPGSKSITNRALILAALADGETTLRGALWSEDTEVMTAALRDLGFAISIEADPAEACNRTLRVQGLGGRIPRAGTAEKPLELFVGNAGTAARFLAAMVCLGDGVYRLHGVPRMHERPQSALFAALRELGYRVDSPNDKLPAVIHGQARNAERGTRNCKVSVAESSQFASALLLAAERGGWQIEVTGANADELPYVEMTRELVKVFPKAGGEFQVEPDASSGSYFWAAGGDEPATEIAPPEHKRNERGGELRTTTWSFGVVPSVCVNNWPHESGWQIDSQFPLFFMHVSNLSKTLPWNANEIANGPAEIWGDEWQERQEKEYQKYLELFEAEHGPVKVSRRTDLGDSIMTLIALAPMAAYKIVFADLGRLRVQECERVVALRTELTKCGAKVVEEGDTLTVYPSELHGAEIETYNDHRMAMCFAVLGLRVPGIKLRNPSCVKKTFPNFFQKLAAAPPYGLGAKILNARTGEALEHQDLFAA